MAIKPATSRESRFLLICAIVAWLVVVLPRLELRQCYDWDAAQYAWGTERYSVAEHRPHPPGYWLYVQLLKVAGALMMDTMAGMTHLSVAMTLGAGWIIARWRGIPAAVAFGFSPIVLFLAPSQTTYIAEALTGALVGWLAWRVMEGETHLLPWLYGAGGLAAGLRPNTLTYCLPLFVLAAFHARRAGWRVWWKSTVSGVAAVLVWLAPQVLNAGGWQAYRHIVKGQAESSFAGSSVLYGASWAVQLDCTIIAVAWFAFGAAPAALVQVWSMLRPSRWPALREWVFYAVWFAAAAFMVFVLHAAKAGYVAFMIPAAIVFFSRGLTMRRACAIAAISVTAIYVPWHTIEAKPPYSTAIRGIKRAIPRHQYEIEASHRRLSKALAPVPQGTLGVAHLNLIEGISHRTLRWSHPNVRWVLPEEFKPDNKEPHIVIGWPGHQWRDSSRVSFARDEVFELWRSPDVSLRQSQE